MFLARAVVQLLLANPEAMAERAAAGALSNQELQTAPVDFDFRRNNVALLLLLSALPWATLRSPLQREKASLSLAQNAHTTCGDEWMSFMGLLGLQVF